MAKKSRTHRPPKVEPAREATMPGAVVRPGRVLQATVFLSGAAVMGVEVVGTRVLAPVYGAGLFVWAALLSVTLCSLAIGYYAGGALADRAPHTRSLALALGWSGGALAIAVIVAPALMRLELFRDPRLGSLAVALVLFGPALVGLGAVGPIVVRLATTDVQFTGHRVGATYAISTAGSLLGTLVVVFYLIPRVGSHVILLGISVMLWLGCALYARAGSRALALALMLAPLPFFDAQARDTPTSFQVVESVQSPYGLLEVIDDRERGLRLLRSDHSLLGGSTPDGVGVFAYTHILEALRFARPKSERMLLIGLGTGTLSMAIERRGIATDVVEIDPHVERLAERHFGYVPSGTVTIEDARTFLGGASGQYDFIVHDTFAGGVTPAHLLSREVFDDARRLLRPGGIMVVNLPGFSGGPHVEAAEAVARTLRSVFPVVRIFRDSDPNGGAQLANLLYFASTEGIDFEIPAGVTFEDDVCERLLRGFVRWEVALDAGDAPVITDATNPMVWMQLPIAEAHHAAMDRLLPAEVWLPW